jgi:hypothetical protein
MGTIGRRASAIPSSRLVIKCAGGNLNKISSTLFKMAKAAVGAGEVSTEGHNRIDVQSFCGVIH